MSKELYEDLQKKGFVTDKPYHLLTTHELNAWDEIVDEYVAIWGTGGENEKLLHEECHKLAWKIWGSDDCEIWYVEDEDGYECIVLEEFPTSSGSMHIVRIRGENGANRTEAIANLLKTLKKL